MNDFASLSSTFVTLIVTYLLHSTILLGLCWLILTLIRSKSHFLAERMWKLATVLGIVTVPHNHATSEVIKGSSRAHHIVN
jgi:hypothetical protein